MSREQIYEALFEKVRYCADFQTVGRRLIHRSQIVAHPALFVVEGPYQHYPEGDYLRPRIPTFEAEIWLMTESKEVGTTSDAPPPAQQLSNLIDAVERAIAGDEPFRKPQTLGIDGVLYCRLQGRVEIDPGHLAGQALAIVPVVIGVAETFLVAGI